MTLMKMQALLVMQSNAAVYKENHLHAYIYINRIFLAYAECMHFAGDPITYPGFEDCCNKGARCYPGGFI